MWKRGRMAVPEQLEPGGGHWKKTRMAHSRSPISAAVMHMHSLGSVWVHNLKARGPSCFIVPAPWHALQIYLPKILVHRAPPHPAPPGAQVLNAKCCIGSAAPIDRSLGLLLRYLGAADLCLARTDQLAAALWCVPPFSFDRPAVRQTLQRCSECGRAEEAGRPARSECGRD